MNWKDRWVELEGKYIAYRVRNRLWFDRVEKVSHTDNKNQLVISLAIDGNLIIEPRSYLDIWWYDTLTELLERYSTNQRAIRFIEDLIIKGLDTK